ncbi:MAG: hypothetical protein HZA51_06560 [Planctomycetes bacterium]|nr:hypothetical protein [Planctomycetota bacterium]
MRIFHRIIHWYETCSRPWLVVAGLVVLLYGWTVPGGFFIDDFRHLRFMREFRDGGRGELGLYRFLRSDAENAAMRGEGYYPWWVGDDVRYQHSRPWAERWLYRQYAMFGDQAWPYHVVSLAMYVVGVLTVGRLFRLLLPGEREARWAALIFAVAGSHAVSVVFVSMQCDLLGLLLIGAAMCMAIRFVRDAGAWRLPIAILCYWLALGAKESSLPTALLPALAGWALATGKAGRDARPTMGTMVVRQGVARRGVIASALLLAVGVIWLASYARGGYGANNAWMLDPLRAPGHYFSELWTRAGILLSTWLLPVNPFLFYLRRIGVPFFPYLAGVGVVTLAVFVWITMQRVAQAAAWVIWTVAFLPLLVCTVPDDRNMLLPGVGFAAMGAMWMGLEKAQRHKGTEAQRGEGNNREQGTGNGEQGTGNSGEGEARGVRWIPVFLFILAQVPTGVATAYFVGRTQATVERNLAGGLAAFGRPVRGGDHIVFLNIDNDAQVLFAQYMLDWQMAGGDRSVGAGPTVTGDRGFAASNPRLAPRGSDSGVRVSFLTDIRNPKVTRVDDHTLRLEGVEEPMLAGFLGAMGRPRGRERREGDEVDAGAYTVRITRMKDGDVWGIEARFKESLSSDSVRLMRCVVGLAPERVGK